jgi:acyl-CoA thioesterase
MERLEYARKVFKADAFATTLTGIAIDAVGDHSAVCSLPLESRHRNARGVAMGGVLFTMADFAAAIAANSECLQDDNLQWVSLDATIHYLAPAACERLVAICEPVKVGRSTALFQTKIENPDNGNTLAVVGTTMMHI